MPAAVAQQILTAVVSLVQGLALTGISPSAVVQRMLPKVDETIDELSGTLPGIFVCPNTGVPEDVKFVSFEDDAHVTYGVIVAVVDANNRDYLTKLPLYQEWREQIRVGLGVIPLSGISGATVWDMRFRGEKAFDTRLLSQQFAYLALLPVYTSCESRF